MRRLGGLLALVLLLAGRASPAAAATVEGRVTLRPPSAVPVPQPRYPVAATYTVRAPDPPAAIVYVDGSFADGVAAAPATVAQQGYQFAPGLIAVRRGSIVRFPNLDDEYHSVFSYSKTRRFDLGRYQRDETPPTLRFDQAGVVRLFCEIHEHMRGTILVLDTPYFTRTDAEGRYRLDGLPTGRFTVKAWLDEDTVRAQTVEVREGPPARADFPE